MTNELYGNVGKMDAECFAPLLWPYQTSLVKLIGNYVFEGLESNKIRIGLRELNLYSAHPRR